MIAQLNSLALPDGKSLFTIRLNWGSLLASPLALRLKFRLSDHAGRFVESSSLRDDAAQLNVPILACWFPLAMVGWKLKLEAMSGLYRI